MFSTCAGCENTRATCLWLVWSIAVPDNFISNAYCGQIPVLVSNYEVQSFVSRIFSFLCGSAIDEILPKLYMEAPLVIYYPSVNSVLCKTPILDQPLNINVTWLGSQPWGIVETVMIRFPSSFPSLLNMVVDSGHDEIYICIFVPPDTLPAPRSIGS